MIYMERMIQFNIRLTANEHKRLRLEALERNMSAADLIRQAVKMFIHRYAINEEDFRTVNDGASKKIRKKKEKSSVIDLR